MGNCLGGAVSEEDKENQRIERELKKAKQTEEGKIKLLLLGAGESGKSTLFKQMKILYSRTKNFTPAERAGYVSIIHGNIIGDMKTLIAATDRHTALDNRAPADIVLGYKKHQALGPEEGEVLADLWKDNGIVQTWADRGDIQVQDALGYYMKEIVRIADPAFSPTNEDILRSRVRTSGVVQESFQVDQTKFEMYDVGGQRNERRKWIHSFENVTSVMFVAAISEYNQVLYEDSTVNRQDEAVELFRQQLESKWFISIPMILFLNKCDLFREKLPKIPFRVDDGEHRRNTEFQGPHCDMNKNYSILGDDEEFEACYTAACNHLQYLYESQRPPNRKAGIYTHITNSTDTSNISHIMNACKDIILRDNLRNGGWFTE